MTADCTLDLTVTVEIEEWSYIKRRLGYLEALLLRILREESAIQEWFSAAELEAMRLPGLPPSLRGIARKATAENWPSIWRNRKYHYHVSALPARAYDALIARLIDLPPLDHDLEGVFSLPSPQIASPSQKCRWGATGQTACQSAPIASRASANTVSSQPSSFACKAGGRPCPRKSPLAGCLP